MATDADNRRWLIAQFDYMFGRAPSVAELDAQVRSLRTHTRSWWVTRHEKVMTDDAVRRAYKASLGRDPTDAELLWQSNRLKAGGWTRRQMLEELNTSSEGLLREPEEEPDPAQENARDYLTSVLERYGLSGLGDWAWEQIQAGHTNERILQDLRETSQYKQRFVGMEARRAAGLPAISESEYIGYETSVRQLMRAAGMPADFYDAPQDFADFIGQDVSVAEMQSRINEGFLAASQAPAEVRQQLRDLYGVGEAQLTAFFLDPDRALPLIERQWAAAKVSGAAVTTGYGALNQTEAERLASVGVTGEQAAEGFSALAENEELFGALPGEQDGLISRETQQAAVFENNADARGALERKAGARRSAGSGAQAFAVGSAGVSGLGDRK